MMVVLVVCTIVAVVAAAIRGPMGAAEFVAPPVWNEQGIPFLIALMGWMPTPLDVAVWASVWMLARTKQTGHAPSMRGALFDFNLGYIATLVMALMFLSLGALVMFGTPEAPAPSAAGFAAQLVNMYARALGDWSRPVIAAAAFITMLSTTITVVDGFPRVTAVACKTVWPALARWGNGLYWGVMLAGIGGTMVVLLYLVNHMRSLIDFVTTLAFLSAPLLAYISCRIIGLGNIPREFAPPRWLRWLSWAGLVFLTGFSVLYLISLAEYGQ
jgi:Mn2+/Fe2+ NRAMP family transporter